MMTLSNSLLGLFTNIKGLQYFIQLYKKALSITQVDPLQCKVLLKLVFFTSGVVETGDNQKKL